MYTRKNIPRVVYTFAVVNRDIRLTFRCVYNERVHIFIGRYVKLYMSREARSAETYQARSPYRFKKFLFGVCFRRLNAVIEPAFTVGFYRNALNDSSVRKLDVAYSAHLARYACMNGCADKFVAVAYNLTYRYRVADFNRRCARGADVLLHRQHNFLRLGYANNFCFGSVFLVVDFYAAAHFNNCFQHSAYFEFAHSFNPFC